MSLISWVSEHWIEITAGVGGLVTLASVVVKLTPGTGDDEALSKFMKFWNAIALNPKKVK